MPTSPSTRRDVILDELRRRGSVRIGDLAGQLDVSPLTVRRDIVALDDAGRLRKVHGGAVDVRLPAGLTDGAAVRVAASGEVGASAAQAVVRLVSPGDAVALVGTAAADVVAGEIVGRGDLRPLTVVTTSITAALLLSARRDPRLTVLLPGGEQSPSGMLVGAVADRTLSDLRVDVAIFAAPGIGPDGRVTAASFAEAATCRAALGAAARTVLVATHDQLTRPSLAQWATLADVDVVVTPARPDEATEHLLTSAGVELVVTGEDEASRAAVRPGQAVAPGDDSSHGEVQRDERQRA